MRIMFMGTPDFAVPTLEALLMAGHEIVCAISQPDKPVGRKRELIPTPVKQFALANGVAVFQPQTLKDGALLETLDRLKPELIVVVAYGRILPEYVLNYPKFGCINGHGSLLPKYRGAAPIQWAIANGEKVTGVTAMYMSKGLDEGDMILKEQTEIGEEETSEELFERLSAICAETIIKTVELIESGKAVRQPQNVAEATYAPIITKENGRIDWTKSSKDIKNLVRAMIPWPVCYTITPLGVLKVYGCKVLDRQSGSMPGEVLDYIPGTGLVIKTKDGALALYDIQLEGKKRMNVEEFMRGRSFEKGTVFE